MRLLDDVSVRVSWAFPPQTAKLELGQELLAVLIVRFMIAEARVGCQKVELLFIRVKSEQLDDQIGRLVMVTLRINLLKDRRLLLNIRNPLMFGVLLRQLRWHWRLTNGRHSCDGDDWSLVLEYVISQD